MEGAKAKRTKVRDVRQEKGAVASIPSEFNMDYYLDDKISRESQQLLKFLPEVVWLLVMDQLSDHPGDLENLSNASSYFRQLLIPRRVLYLFPSVLHATLPYIVNFHVGTAKHEWQALRQKRGEMLKVLNYRLVCSSWNQSLDTYIQQGHYFQESGQHKHVVRSKFLSSLCNTIEAFRSNTLPRFLCHFETTHLPNSPRSPFVNNAFHMHFCFPRYPEVTLKLINQTTTLLQKYGRHIAEFRLTIPNNLPYLTLRKWLVQCPNLKCLEISVADSAWRRPMIVNARELEVELREHPLPKFYKLEKLQIFRLPTLIFNELVRTANPIFSLKYMQMSKEHDGYNLAGIPAQNLKSLTITLCHQKHFLEFSQSSAFFSPLTKLTIIMPNMLYIQWEEVFQSIQNRCGRTLRQLFLDLPYARNQEGAHYVLLDSFTCRLDLPILRQLELRMQNPAHLDFLLPLRNTLECLDIELSFSLNYPSRRRNVAEVEFVPVVQFIGFETRLLESNIWTLFPNLKKICVAEDLRSSVFQYTREQWFQLHHM